MKLDVLSEARRESFSQKAGFYQNSSSVQLKRHGMQVVELCQDNCKLMSRHCLSKHKGHVTCCLITYNVI